MYPSEEFPTAGIFVQQQIQGLRSSGLAVDVMIIDRQGAGWRAYVGMSQSISARMASSKCDIVHAMYGGVLSQSVIQAARGIPSVVSICGSDLLGTIRQWPFGPLRSWVSRTASIKACKAAGGIVVKSKGLANALPPSIKRGKVHIVPNGIDTELFCPMDREACLRELGWASDAFHIVFSTGRYPQVKRLDLARESAELTRQLGVPAEFHVMTGVSHEKVPTYLNAGNALLLTSMHEGSPNIVKEALACNTPIVSVDVGDVAERIGPIDGCHVVGADPALIAAKLKAVADRGSRVNSRPGVLDLSLLKVAERLKAIYNSVLEAR
jgi:glycosyltransferase involved in cell wall biosynthesis